MPCPAQQRRHPRGRGQTLQRSHARIRPIIVPDRNKLRTFVVPSINKHEYPQPKFRRYSAHPSFSSFFLLHRPAQLALCIPTYPLDLTHTARFTPLHSLRSPNPTTALSSSPSATRAASTGLGVVLRRQHPRSGAHDEGAQLLQVRSACVVDGCGKEKEA